MVSLGIDIGSFSIKVAQAEMGPRGFTLLDFREFPLSQDPTKDKSIEVIDILRNLFAQFDLSQTRVVFGEKQARVSSRFLEFPFKERHKILKSLPFELEENIPFSIENAIYDAKTISFRKTSAQVLALANPKDNVQRWFQLAADSGITGDILSLDSLAFCNLSESWQNPPPELNERLPELPEAEACDLHLMVGHKSTLLLLKSNGVLRALRNIDWGGKNIVDHIGRKYSLNYVEALKEFRAKGFVLASNEGATRDQVEFSDTIKGAIDELAHEIKLSLMEIQGDFEFLIHQGFLSGGVSSLKGFGAYLTQHIEVSFNRYRYLSNFAIHGMEENPEIESKAAISIGLAIEGLKKPRNPPVNFFRGEFEKKSQDLQRLWQKYRHAVQVACAIFVVLVIWGVFRDSIAEKLSNNSYDVLKNQAGNIANLRGSAASVRNINKFLKEQESLERNRAVAENVKKLNSAMEILADISGKMPRSKELRLEVKRFLVDNNVVELEGVVSGAQALINVKKTLESVASDGKVENLTPTLRPSATGQQAFNFRLKVQRSKGT